MMDLKRLQKRRQELENLYYQKGVFEPDIWEELASGFEKAKKPSAGKRIREKAKVIKDIIANEKATE